MVRPLDLECYAGEGDKSTWASCMVAAGFGWRFAAVEREIAFGFAQGALVPLVKTRAFGMTLENAKCLP